MSDDKQYTTLEELDNIEDTSSDFSDTMSDIVIKKVDKKPLKKFSICPSFLLKISVIFISLFIVFSPQISNIFSKIPNMSKNNLLIAQTILATTLVTISNFVL